MPKFRKRSIIIEAEQWFPGKVVDGVRYEGSRPTVMTLEGPLIVSPGDWIITGVTGEKYPCKPDIFKLTYERVEEQDAEHTL